MNTIKHTNYLRREDLNGQKTNCIEFLCRGWEFGRRETILKGYISSISGEINSAIDNSYLTLEEEPENRFDADAVLIVSRGEIFGAVGYVEKGMAKAVKDVLNRCKHYRVDLKNPGEVGEHALIMVLTWTE